MIPKKRIRATVAKGAGMKNPIEEAAVRPNLKSKFVICVFRRAFRILARLGYCPFYCCFNRKNREPVVDLNVTLFVPPLLSTVPV